MQRLKNSASRPPATPPPSLSSATGAQALVQGDQCLNFETKFLEEFEVFH
jgi:hypothetical protein